MYPIFSMYIVTQVHMHLIINIYHILCHVQYTRVYPSIYTCGADLRISVGMCSPVLGGGGECADMLMRCGCQEPRLLCRV